MNALSSTASSSSRSLLALGSAEKSRGKSKSAAYTTQCIGLSGVSRRVHIGCDLGTGLGLHSKHAVRPRTCAVTCPRYPVVPDSISGTSAARHSRLTCFLASRLSSPLRTTSKVRTKSTSKEESLTLPWCATMRASGRNLSTVSLATWGREPRGQDRLWAPLGSCWKRIFTRARDRDLGAGRTFALDMPTCRLRNRNWRLRLLTSMVSRSIISISSKPLSTRVLSSSQPMPPAPTIRTAFLVGKRDPVSGDANDEYGPRRMDAGTISHP